MREVYGKGVSVCQGSDSDSAVFRPAALALLYKAAVQPARIGLA